MQGQIYTTYQYTLAAGERVDIHRLGSFASCLAATADFEIGFDNGDRGEFAAGLTYEASAGKGFRSVALINTSGATNVIKLAIGFGRVTDARLTLGSGAVIQGKTAPIWTESGAQSVGAGLAASVLAANVNRAEALICNDGTKAFYVRGDNVTAPGGVVVAPGATVVLSHSGAVYVYNPDVAAASVLRSETEWA